MKVVDNHTYENFLIKFKQALKTILKILGLIIVLIILYAVIAMVSFSKNYHFEKSIVINAPKEKVWQYVGSTKAL